MTVPGQRNPKDRAGPPEQFDAAVRAGLRYAWHSHLIHHHDRDKR